MRENSATTAKQRSGLLSVVLPAYNEEATLFKTAKVIPSILDSAGIPFEIVFVSDGSKDGTWDEICAAAAGIPESAVSGFRETSARKLLFLRALRRLRENARPSWTAICSIRRKS